MDRLGAAAKKCLEAAHEKDKIRYNATRVDVPIKEGDSVYINIRYTQHIPDSTVKNNARSLRSKFVGPYKVLKVLGENNVELELPNVNRRSDAIYHISQLRHQRSFPGAMFTAPWETSGIQGLCRW